MALLRVFLKAVAEAWNDNVPRLGASLAYYTLFAFAPVVLVATAIANGVYRDAGIGPELVGQINGLVGTQGGRAVEAMVESARAPGGGFVAGVTGSIAFVLAATGAFLELQAALDAIWRVTPKPGLSLGSFLKDRLRSFGVMVGVGLLLLASLIASAAVAAAGTWLAARVPQAPWILSSLNAATQVTLTTGLFAMLFRYLPDVELAWRDVLTGALVTALLFTAGEYLIGMYLGLTAIASAYGAAGSVVLLLLWVYYSAQVFLIGAEFTRLHADQRGLLIKTQEFAEPCDEPAAAATSPRSSLAPSRASASSRRAS